MRVYRQLSLLAAASAGLFLVGCAGPSPNYAPSIDNVQTLKQSGAAPVTIGAFTATPGMAGAASLTLRANTMNSSVGANYGDYLGAALRSELELAKLYDPKSAVAISGVLTKNNVNAGGIATNDGQIAARFIVKNGDQVRYDQTKSVEHQWEGAFAAATAIPQAASNYPVMVQKLITQLLADPSFISALKN